MLEEKVLFEDEDAPVCKAVDHMLAAAINDGVTELRIFPNADGEVCVDHNEGKGRWYRKTVLAVGFEAVTARLKLLTGADIAQRNRSAIGERTQFRNLPQLFTPIFIVGDEGRSSPSVHILIDFVPS